MRLRAEYHADMDLCFLSALDMMHLMERALRRAKMPYALSEGFNPHVRLSLGTVLPVGLWGQREYFDLELTRSLAADDFAQQLNLVLPPSLGINRAKAIDANVPALMKAINSASYCFVIDLPVVELENLAQDLLAKTELQVRGRGKKKGQTKELRPGIHKITVNKTGDFAIMEIWVSAGEPVNVRYDELADLLGQYGVGSNHLQDVFRSGNYIREDERFYSPFGKGEIT